MRTYTKKLLTCLCAVSLSLCALAGCTNTSPKGTDTDTKEANTDAVTDKQEEEAVTLPEYDFYSLDKSPYIKLPEDWRTRDYRAGLALLGEPTDAYVSSQIKTNYLSKIAKEVKLDESAAVQNFDSVVMDYTGKLDGVAFEGGSATDSKHDVLLDASTFIDGFDAGLIGMKAGETKDLNLRFPNPYQNNPDLAGKEVVFTVTIDKISRLDYPELTDALIADHKDVFGDEYKTAEEFVDAIRKELASQYESYDNDLIIDGAWSYLAKNSEFLSYPEEILAGYENAVFKSYEMQIKQYGYTLESYILNQGYLSVDDFKEKEIKVQAKGILEEKLIMYSCADALGIRVTDEQALDAAKEEFEQYADVLAAYYGITDVEGYLNYMGGLGTYRDNVLFSGIMTKLCALDTAE